MTDLALRLHQRSAVAGDIEAEARHLRERLRAGTLTRARLRLAAYCGHGAARVVAEFNTSCRCGHAWRRDGFTSSISYMDCLWCQLPHWLTDLRNLATDLDGLGEREMQCKDFYHQVNWGPDQSPCGSCGLYLDGVRLVPWDPTEWLLLRAATAAAELAHDLDRCDASWVIDAPCLTCRVIESAKDYQRLGTLAAREVCYQHWQTTEPGSAWGLMCCYISGTCSPEALPNSIQDSADVLGKPCKRCLNICETSDAYPQHICSEIGTPCSNCCRCNGTGRIPNEAAVREAICTDLIQWSLN